MKKRNHKRGFEKALISWHAPEYPHHEKSLLWFLIAALIIGILVFYGLETNGWTFSIALIVFAGTYYLIYRHKPRMVEVKVSGFGVKIGTQSIPFSSIKHFWVLYDPPHLKRLYLRMSSRFYPDIFVSLEDIDPANLRRLLSAYIKELEGRHEPFSDTLVRLLKL